MHIIPWIPKEHFRYLIPYFEYRKLLEHLGWQLIYLFLILDTLLDEHTNLLMVVIDIIMFEYLTLCIVAYHLKELLRLPPQLLIYLLHDFDINRKCWYINIEFYLLDKLDEIDLFTGDDVANVSVDYDVLVVYLQLLEFYQSVLLVYTVLLHLLKIYAEVCLAQVEILTSHHTLVSLLTLYWNLPPCVILLLVAVQLKVLILLRDL